MAGSKYSEKNMPKNGAGEHLWSQKRLEKTPFLV